MVGVRAYKDQNVSRTFEWNKTSPPWLTEWEWQMNPRYGPFVYTNLINSFVRFFLLPICISN
jgi:hypothetical protein